MSRAFWAARSTRALRACALDRAARLSGVLARDLRHVERSARYLAELSRFEPRDDDVFVCTYPRSGTTWTQLLVHLVLRDDDFGFAHIDDVVPWFERPLALGRRSAAQLNALAAPRVFKSHLLPRWLPTQGRVVYVCRDVSDVAASYYHFYRSQLGYSGSREAFFERFVRGRVQYRSWFGHVAAWREAAASRPILWLEYESMLDDLRATVAQLGGFLGVELSERRLDTIAELGSFAHMKGHEARFAHETAERRARAAEGQFLRRGTRGDGPLLLSQVQRQALQAQALRRDRSTLLDLPAFLH